MRTTLSFSKLLGGTWILWLAAVYIFARTAIFLFQPIGLIIDLVMAIALMICAVYQAEKNKTNQYAIECYKKRLAEEEKKREEILRQEKSNWYASTINMIAKTASAFNAKLTKKPRKK